MNKYYKEKCEILRKICGNIQSGIIRDAVHKMYKVVGGRWVKKGSDVKKETAWMALTRRNDLVCAVCDGCCYWQLSCSAQAIST